MFLWTQDTPCWRANSAHAAHVQARPKATRAELTRQGGLSDQKIKKGTFVRIEKLSFWESPVKIRDLAGTLKVGSSNGTKKLIACCVIPVEIMKSFRVQRNWFFGIPSKKNAIRYVQNLYYVRVFSASHKLSIFTIEQRKLNAGRKNKRPLITNRLIFHKGVTQYAKSIRTLSEF